METATKDETAKKSGVVTFFLAVMKAGLALTVHLFVTMAIVVFLVGIVPTYIEFFEVNDTPLPPFTMELVRLSLSAGKYWYLIFVALFLFNGPIAFAVQFLPARMHWLKVCWFDGYLLAAIVFLMCGSIALQLPIWHILDQSSRP